MGPRLLADPAPEGARSGRAIGGPVLLGMAGAGVIAGHAATYALYAPDAAWRRELLRQTGHGWWPAAVVAAQAVAVLVIAAGARRHVRTAMGGSPSSLSPRPVLVRLAVAQVVLFWAVEVAERLVAGSGPVVDRRLLLLGAGVQVAVAVLGTAVLCGLQRAAALAVALARPLPRCPRGSSPVPEPAASSPATGRRGPASPRGPPPRRSPARVVFVRLARLGIGGADEQLGLLHGHGLHVGRLWIGAGGDRRNRPLADGTGSHLAPGRDGGMAETNRAACVRRGPGRRETLPAPPGGSVQAIP